MSFEKWPGISEITIERVPNKLLDEGCIQKIDGGCGVCEKDGGMV